jgi:hypothetical protein
MKSITVSDDELRLLLVAVAVALLRHWRLPGRCQWTLEGVWAHWI